VISAGVARFASRPVCACAWSATAHPNATTPIAPM